MNEMDRRSRLCCGEDDDGVCAELAEADGYCDAHHPMAATQGGDNDAG